MVFSLFCEKVYIHARIYNLGGTKPGLLRCGTTEIPLKICDFRSNYLYVFSILEEGGKEGKRGPFRGQNFCRLEEGCPDVGGARVRGRGWSEGGTPGEAGEKTHHIYSISAKSGKRVEK